jgi:hypothetical protein
MYNQRYDQYYLFTPDTRLSTLASSLKNVNNSTDDVFKDDIGKVLLLLLPLPLFQ